MKTKKVIFQAKNNPEQIIIWKYQSCTFNVFLREKNIDCFSSGHSLAGKEKNLKWAADIVTQYLKDQSTN